MLFQWICPVCSMTPPRSEFPSFTSDGRHRFCFGSSISGGGVSPVDGSDMTFASYFFAALIGDLLSTFRLLLFPVHLKDYAGHEDYFLSGANGSSASAASFRRCRRHQPQHREICPCILSTSSASSLIHHLRDCDVHHNRCVQLTLLAVSFLYFTSFYRSFMRLRQIIHKSFIEHSAWM